MLISCLILPVSPHLNNTSSLIRVEAKIVDSNSTCYVNNLTQKKYLICILFACCVREVMSRWRSLLINLYLFLFWLLLQYRQMRRKEQDRLSRMDADYQIKKEVAEFNMRREERLKAAEERTAKKRAKRQKKRQRKKEKKIKVNSGAEEPQKEESSDDEGDSDIGEAEE